MSKPTTFRPSKFAAKRLKSPAIKKIKSSEIYRLAVDECFEKYPTADALRAAILAKHAAEYGL